MAKILYYDIETSPNLGYIWAKYQQDVIAFKNEWELLSFAYKWEGEKKTHALGRDNYTEQELTGELHKLFNEADILVAHNGNKFDQKKVNAKFLQFGFDPPSPYKQIDTLQVAKRYFKLNSNKLDDIGNLLGVGRKVQTGGFALWLGCMENDPKAWAKMLRYNKQDVVLLQNIYKKLRPWINNHPGLNILDNKPAACPKCGVEGKMQSRGTEVTKTTIKPKIKCTACGGWSYGRLTQRTDVLYVN